MKNSIVLIFLIASISTFATKPTDPKATPETVKLYQNLLKLGPTSFI